jgi:putative DNA primase/helicase
MAFDWNETGFYKAYLQMQNVSDKKAPNGEYTKTNKNHCELSQVQSLDKYLGILNKNVVLLDADDEINSIILLNLIQGEKLNCMITERESGRGNHALFLDEAGLIQKCGTGIMLACGIVVDIKIGRKNGLECLKWEDTEREVVYNLPDYVNIPKYLTPVNRVIDFASMTVGDGRNQALFNYILTLQSNDFTMEEARTCIRLINKYVLKAPLSDEELNVILRDAAFMKPLFFNGSTFLHDKFALYLKSNLHIVKIETQLHFYREGIYVYGQKRFNAEMLKLIPQLTKTKRNEVYSYLDDIIEDNVQPTEENLIAFRNGLYDIATDEFKPFAPEHIITNRIEWDYNPNAKSELVDEVLNKISCRDASVRALLEEVVGYCFYRRNALGKCFVLTGEKSNGKSTFLDMVRTMLGEKNTSALDLAEVNEKFSTAEVFNKLANIGDDIGDEFIPNTGIFKKLVTGEELKGERKGQDPFFFHSYAKLLFSANSIPRLGRGKDSAAIARRLIIIPFEAKFGDDDPDYKPYIKYDLRKQPAMEYLILLGLKGLKRVLHNKKFTESSKAQTALNEYEEMNNPILGFFKSIELSDILNEPTNEVYKKYQEFCIRDSLQPISNVRFSLQVKNYYNVDVIDRKIQGKKYRLFVERGN